jgi:adenosylhomocysteinase
MSVLRDASLAPLGEQKIDWAKSYMPLLAALGKEFEETRPLDGLKIALSIHLEAKTACLCLLLKTAGAKVACTGCNPLSTQDDVAAALAARGVEVFAWHGANEEEYTAHLGMTLEMVPDLIIDDGGDFVHLLHGDKKHLAKNLIGGSEETTTGVMRLRSREREGALDFPMISVNDAKCKHLFDNRYGTGQSVWDGIMRSTNLLVAGKNVVVAGYGWCGRGIAMRAAGLGAKVIICDVDPVHALEAAMDGYQVMSMDEAAKMGDLFVTATGCRDIIVGRHFDVMKDGALLANAGHFDVEISKPDLEARCSKIEERRANIMGYTMKDGRTLNLLADGRLVNLAAGDGHPVEIMDMSFAVQALCACYLAQNRGLPKKVHEVPREIDERVALLKLASMGMRIDRLDDAQKKYLESSGE